MVNQLSKFSPNVAERTQPARSTVKEKYVDLGRGTNEGLSRSKRSLEFKTSVGFL